MADDALPTRRSIKRAASNPLRGKKKKSQLPGAALHNDRVHAEKQQARAQALQLRRAGANYPDIGRRMGVSTATAHRYVKEALAEIPQEDALALRALLREEIARSKLNLNMQLQKATTAAEVARLEDSLTRAREQQIKLEGLAAPERHEHSIVDRINASSVREMSDDDLRRLASGDFGSLSRPVQ